MVFFSLCFSFFSSDWEEENVKRKRLKQKGRTEAWRQAPSLLCIFFCSLWFFFPFAWKEEDVKRKRLKQKCKSGRVEMGTKSERATQELEGKLPPFFAFFSSLWFIFSLCVFFFFCLKRRC
jgi:hypothetical protein